MCLCALVTIGNGYNSTRRTFDAQCTSKGSALRDQARQLCEHKEKKKTSWLEKTNEISKQISEQAFTAPWFCIKNDADINKHDQTNVI